MDYCSFCSVFVSNGGAVDSAPNATIIISGIVAAVSVMTLVVAWSQMKIASAKTKLDLYNKRFSVYLAALEYYQYAYSDNRVDLKQKAEKLTHAYRESKFLFDLKDGVHETLGRVQKGTAAVRAYEEQRTNGKLDLERESILLKLQSEALLAMGKDLLTLEEQLSKYLSFHNVRGWTIL
ncbi:hypothetical protein [Pseudomonas putida]|uniref:hypothetical protein n=1 Tax=Pseudomonas putida TaxID=303 RepID=UPI00068E05FD|nr:hypothetical protein [Pseudomonas putida]